MGCLVDCCGKLPYLHKLEKEDYRANRLHSKEILDGLENSSCWHSVQVSIEPFGANVEVRSAYAYRCAFPRTEKPLLFRKGSI